MMMFIHFIGILFVTILAVNKTKLKKVTSVM